MPVSRIAEATALRSLACRTIPQDEIACYVSRGGDSQSKGAGMPHSVSSFTRLTSIRTVLTRVGAAILLVLGAAVTTVVFTAAVPRSAAHAASGPNGDVSVNLFEWNWDSVAAECTN